MYGKDFFASKTTWGAIMLLIGPALRYFGIQLDEQALIDALSTITGLVVFTWGQLTRKDPIVSVGGVEVKK